MAKSVLMSWFGFNAQHRYEDLMLISDVIIQHHSRIVVELGTAEGGFAAFLADTVRPWGGRVVTIDHVQQFKAGLFGVDRPNLEFVLLDCLAQPAPEIIELIRQPGVMLYCDNGNKEREIELYAPAQGPRALLGCHDYEDEVRPDVIEPFLVSHGFTPHRHADFEALAHPEWYPRSLTRFWTRR